MNKTRQRIVAAAQGALASRAHWRYAEVRPIPYATFNALMDGADVTITTDCSGLATCCYQRAGAPDPNGQGYDGSGFTGTMLATLPPIALSKARPGDLAVFGTFPGKHVVVIVGPGTDPQCISHGGPGDPKEAPLSHFLGIGPLTVLKGVATIPTPIPRTRWQLRVTGKADKHLPGAHGIYRWVLRHPHLVHQQQGHLHFDPVEAAPKDAANPAADA
jgi:hypothetical protein